MYMQSISFSPTESNIEVTRRFAREQGLSLQKVRNEVDLWDLKDLQTGKTVQRHKPLFDIHSFLCNNLE